jgi:hypothetical protein
MGKATLQLELTTAAGSDLNDFVRIELFSATSSLHARSLSCPKENGQKKR